MKHGKYLLIFCIALVLLSTLLLASCGSFTGFKRNYVGTNTGREITGRYELLNGTQTKDIRLEEGQTIAFLFLSAVEEGSLEIKFYDPDKELLGEMETEPTVPRHSWRDKSIHAD